MIQRFLPLILLFTGVLIKAPLVFAQKNDSVAVIKAAEKFVYSFNHFQWESFRKSFAADASIFFPEWDHATRISGKENIEKKWLQLFPEFVSNPDNYKLQISPKNILVQLYGQTAVMTFHLGDAVSRLARRTIVWKKSKGIWMIVHLHASVLKKETETKSPAN